MAATSTDTTHLQVEVVDLDGKSVGTIDLPGAWFDGKINIGVMHDVVTAQRAASRQGTHKTKTRGEVRGGGAKPWRQKGTGRARHGSIRSPIWVGGGVAHGRTPKDWSKRVNKKVRRAALRSSLTDRARNDVVVVVRELTFAAPRTKDAVAALAAWELDTAKVLVVLPGRNEATEKSFRNLPNVHLLTVDQLNTHDVLVSDVVVFDESAIAAMPHASESATSAIDDESSAPVAASGGEAAGEADDSSLAEGDQEALGESDESSVETDESDDDEAAAADEEE